MALKTMLILNNGNDNHLQERPLKLRRAVPETAATALKMIHFHSDQTQSKSQKLKTKIVVSLKNSLGFNLKLSTLFIKVF